ncbi:MAG TPA: DUF6151 family protein [Gammaproteobacteria bacterium]|nr:DUF6151 family protein [Gammaproteobacteria bacterium]
MAADQTLTIHCACGRVAIEARGAPLLNAACYCDDCQAAAAQIESLPHAPAVKGADGGTEYMLFRKDRMSRGRGAELLRPHKLREGSPTTRWVASCCNSAMYLGFDDAKHWVDIYRTRLTDERPPLDMRVSTRFKPAGVVIPDDVPQYPGYPFGFILKLIGARFAMMFGG